MSVVFVCEESKTGKITCKSIPSFDTLSKPLSKALELLQVFRH
jgi:hypothetical protein